LAATEPIVVTYGRYANFTLAEGAKRQFYIVSGQDLYCPRILKGAYTMCSRKPISKRSTTSRGHETSLTPNLALKGFNRRSVSLSLWRSLVLEKRRESIGWRGGDSCCRDSRSLLGYFATARSVNSTRLSNSACILYDSRMTSMSPRYLQNH